MKQRIVTGILFTLGVAVLVVPGLKFTLFILVFLMIVGIMATHELIGALKHKGLAPSSVMVYAGVVTFLLPLIAICLLGANSGIVITGPDWIVLSAGMALMCFALISIMSLNMILPLLTKGPQVITSAAAGSLSMAYIAFPLGCSVLLVYTVPYGWYWLLLALLTPWASDVFAYFTGSAIGKHHIVPQISPKKTLEGALGGIVGSMIVLVLFFELILRRLSDFQGSRALHIILALGAGILLSAASQIGDWLASAIKRWCGIKDFGRLLPGHGGILDRFDSAFFTMPVTLLLSFIYWQIF